MQAALTVKPVRFVTGKLGNLQPGLVRLDVDLRLDLEAVGPQRQSVDGVSTESEEAVAQVAVAAPVEDIRQQAEGLVAQIP